MKERGYLGSKAGHGVWQRIAGEIPPHELLLVPFAGHCALTRNLQPMSWRRVLCDRDPAVVEWLRQHFHSHRNRVTVEQRCGIEFLESIASACDREDHLPLTGPWSLRFNDWEPGDEGEWFARHAVIYCDPPYLVSTRTHSESRYRYDMTDTEHERLLSVIRRLPCRVLISGYDSELYRDRLSDWRLVQFNATTRGRQRIRVECLWINREPTSVTHMPLMIATNRRQREIVKRRLQRIEHKAASIPDTDVEHWLRCLGQRRQSGTLSPLVASRAACSDVPITPSPTPATGDRVSHRGETARSWQRRLVLSLFPGIGLLDRAFRDVGFEIVSGPDLIFGGDIRQFSSASLRSVVCGVIGGPPCQAFSAANHQPDRAAGMETIREFIRCVQECEPDWWLAENVPQVPDIQIDGYSWQRCGVFNEWFPQRDDVCARRHRVFQWGTRHGGPLTDRLLDLRPPVDRPQWRDEQLVDCVVAGRRDQRNWREKARLMGLPDDFNVPCLRREDLSHAIGNGVPLPMGRFVAAAVAAAIDDTRSTANSQTDQCQCPCRLPLAKNRRDQRYYSARCRQEALTRRRR